jgi:molybdenum cofactor cytidylyltransferase
MAGMKKFGIIVLAGGSSARMGQPKQTLIFKNQTLLQRIVKEAASINSGPVILVLGANAHFFQRGFENAFTVVNENWQNGMGSSIFCGLKKLLELSPSVEGAIITVCDQPYVNDSLLQKLVDTHQQDGKPIVACFYADTIGTPVLFHHTLFSDLLQISDDKGAKQIVNKDRQRVALVDFPQGSIDVDTEEDYARLLQNEYNAD